jgi:hypothetical protein
MKTLTICLLLAGSLLTSPLQAKTSKLSFAKGAFSTTVSYAVVRGERELYTFKAEDGQKMTAAITALEDNAVFQIEYQVKKGKWKTVKGADYGEDVRVWYGELPHSTDGQYRIVVGGTRGNATYNLFVGLPAVIR